MRNQLIGLALFACALVSAGCGGCAGNKTAPMPRRIVDLSTPLVPDVNLRWLGNRALDFLGTNGRIVTTPVLPQDPAMAFGMDLVQILSHTGSHLDAPSRLLRGGVHPAQVPIEQLFGVARVVDLRWHDPEEAIELNDFEGVKIASGEIVVLLYGYKNPAPDRWPVFPGLSVQVAEWLVAKRIRALATDMPALVSFNQLQQRLRLKQPPEQAWAEYLPFFQAGIPILLGLSNLEQILDEERVAFVGLPLPLAQANGAPMRAAALVY